MMDAMCPGCAAHTDLQGLDDSPSEHALLISKLNGYACVVAILNLTLHRDRHAACKYCAAQLSLAGAG